MGKIQTRGSVSLCKETMEALERYAAENNTTRSGVVEKELRKLFNLPEYHGRGRAEKKIEQSQLVSDGVSGDVRRAAILERAETRAIASGWTPPATDKSVNKAPPPSRIARMGRRPSI